MSLPDWFWELPVAVIAAVVAMLAVVWLNGHIDRRMDKKIEDHKAQDHTTDAVFRANLTERLKDFGDRLRDVLQSVRAVHERLDDHIDEPRRDRSHEDEP